MSGLLMVMIMMVMVIMMFKMVVMIMTKVMMFMEVVILMTMVVVMTLMMVMMAMMMVVVILMMMTTCLSSQRLGWAHKEGTGNNLESCRNVEIGIPEILRQLSKSEILPDLSKLKC